MLGYDMARDKQTLTFLGFLFSLVFAPRNRLPRILFYYFFLSSFFCFFCVSLSSLAGFAHFLWYSYTKIRLLLSPPQPTVFCASLHSSLLFLFPEEFLFYFYLDLHYSYLLLSSSIYLIGIHVIFCIF